VDEQLFFDQGGIKVSNARFIVHGQTYAMNGVTSVKQGVNPPSRGGPLLIGLIGLFFLIIGKYVIGVIAAVLAIFWWTQQKSEWLVVLSSSSGETKALRSHDQTFISSVIDALNNSIVHRG
jgi:hypothetical protein